MSLISIGDKVSFCKYSCRLFPTFTMKGKAKVQVEASENKEIFFFLPEVRDP